MKRIKDSNKQYWEDREGGAGGGKKKETSRELFEGLYFFGE